MPFKRSFRVHWVDTDLAGVMHFTNYMRYFEACEEEFYRSLSLPFNDITAKYGVMLPRIEAYCSYKAPCRFNDAFDITMRAKEVAEKTITWEFQLVRQSDQKLAAEGYIKCIAVNSQWKAIPLPADLAQRVRKEGQ